MHVCSEPSSHSARVCVQGNEGVYARECASQPGFSTSFKDPAANRTSFGDYRRLCAKWQHTTVTSFRLALGSKNYVQTRNALFTLSHIVKVGVKLYGWNLEG